MKKLKSLGMLFYMGIGTDQITHVVHIIKPIVREVDVVPKPNKLHTPLNWKNVGSYTPKNKKSKYDN